MRLRLQYILAMLLFLAMPLYIIIYSGLLEETPRADSLESIILNEYQQDINNKVKNRFPLAEFFSELQLKLFLASGQQEQNGIFISKSGLIKRITNENPEISTRNINAIIEFSDTFKDMYNPTPVFVSILPTSAAILQDNLPLFSNTINQKAYIDNAYAVLAGKTYTVNTYQTLMDNRRQYIYYRTENNFTALGGYFISQQFIKKMLNVEAPSRASYNLSYPKTNFYGSLFKLSPYSEIEADTITLFHYNKFDREYIIRHFSDIGSKVYHSLYTTHLSYLNKPMNIYFGGLSPVVEISSTAPFDRSLIIFADQTALAYVPFLASFYSRITIVNLLQPDFLLQGNMNIRAYEYDQILFAFSTETIMNTEFSAELLENLLQEEEQQ